MAVCSCNISLHYSREVCNRGARRQVRHCWRKDCRHRSLQAFFMVIRKRDSSWKERKLVGRPWYSRYRQGRILRYRGRKRISTCGKGRTDRLCRGYVKQRYVCISELSELQYPLMRGNDFKLYCIQHSFKAFWWRVGKKGCCILYRPFPDNNNYRRWLCKAVGCCSNERIHDVYG